MGEGHLIESVAFGRGMQPSCRNLDEGWGSSLLDLLLVPSIGQSQVEICLPSSDEKDDNWIRRGKKKRSGTLGFCSEQYSLSPSHWSRRAYLSEVQGYLELYSATKYNTVM